MMFLELFRQRNDSALNLNANAGASLLNPRFVLLYVLLQTAYRTFTVMNSIYRKTLTSSAVLSGQSSNFRGNKRRAKLFLHKECFKYVWAFKWNIFGPNRSLKAGSSVGKNATWKAKCKYWKLPIHRSKHSAPGLDELLHDVNPQSLRREQQVALKPKGHDVSELSREL